MHAVNCIAPDTPHVIISFGFTVRPDKPYLPGVVAPALFHHRPCACILAAKQVRKLLDLAPRSSFSVTPCPATTSTSASVIETCFGFLL